MFFSTYQKVWHEGLILTLKLDGISENLLKTMEDFLATRYQRLVLSGQDSKWAAVKAGLLQNSILGP